MRGKHIGNTQYTVDILRQGIPMLSAGLGEDKSVLERDIAEAVERATTATA